MSHEEANLLVFYIPVLTHGRANLKSSDITQTVTYTDVRGEGEHDLNVLNRELRLPGKRCLQKMLTGFVPLNKVFLAQKLELLGLFFWAKKL